MAVLHIDRIDHVVMTVRDIEVTCDFYARVLGMPVITFAENRRALACGDNKVNLHEYGKEFEPKAPQPNPGALDICLTPSVPLTPAIVHIRAGGVVIEERPGER